MSKQGPSTTSPEFDRFDAAMSRIVKTPKPSETATAERRALETKQAKSKRPKAA